jgi:glycosyltransferase involved in cell wall biosynthesis
MTTHLVDALASVLQSTDFLMAHNVLTKHFNLPLTAALFRMLDAGMIRRCAAWCHDMSWTSPRSRPKMHEGYPWEFLRTRRPEISYVTVSNGRQQELADLFGCRPQEIRVIYNGVDPAELLALSEEGLALIDRLDMWNSDLNLLMPVRVTQAKNIELAIHVAAALKEKGINPNIVVTGPPDPHDPMNMEYFQSLLSLRNELGVDQQVHFVYHSGPNPVDPLIVAMPIVAELFRVSDALFMPSRREGFGMPILEAGLAGIPVFSTDHVPAANEIGGQNVIRFSAEADPDQVAGLIIESIGKSPMLQLRRRVRQGLTWRSIFNRQIIPLLEGNMNEI